jgi:hypothetical protein
MDMQNEHRNDEGLEAPPELAAAFKQLPAEPIFVPPTMDEALLKSARLHLCPRKEREPTGFA